MRNRNARQKGNYRVISDEITDLLGFKRIGNFFDVFNFQQFNQ